MAFETIPTLAVLFSFILCIGIWVRIIVEEIQDSKKRILRIFA